MSPDLNDADLERELRRRAESARLRSDWARFELLPAVLSRMENGVDRVPSSRLAALAGIAAMAAVLVLLVVALPRFVPGPAASPSAVSGIDDPSPTSLAEPTSGPIASPPEPGVASKAVPCPYAGGDAETAEVAITDHVGLVLDCVTSTPGTDRPSKDPGSGASVSNPGRNTTQLEVFWREPALCDTVAELELMRVEAGYMLVVDSLPGDATRMCRLPSHSYHGVTLQLATPIAADDVQALLLHSGRNVSMADTSGNRFYLSIGSGKREYSAGDAIAVDAELGYSDGPDTLEANTQLGFGFEQLDGDLEMAPGWPDICMPQELRGDDPLRVPYGKSGGYSPEDPNAEFYRRYLDDPELRLPPGIWRIYALANLIVGHDCGGESLSLTASVIVRTTAVPADGPSPAPEPSSSPGPTSSPQTTARTIECPYATGEDRPLEVEIGDHSGLVIGCGAFVELSTPDEFVRATNVGSDQTMLEVRWEIPEVCSSMPVRIGLWGPLNYEPPLGLPPPFVLQIDHAADPESDQGCIDSVATQGVRLSLNSAVSAADIEAFRTSGGSGFDESRFEDHSLALSIADDALEFEAGEPIEVTASFVYTGPRTSVTLDSQDPNPAFGFHQLDGTVRQGPGSDLITQAIQLERNLPLVIPYRKSGFYVTNDADGPFSEEAYWADPELRLPPGVYRVYVSGGGDLDGNFWDRDSRVVYARASIIIHVR
jgi:hypothetical protein